MISYYTFVFYEFVFRFAAFLISCLTLSTSFAADGVRSIASPAAFPILSLLDMVFSHAKYVSSIVPFLAFKFQTIFIINLILSVISILKYSLRTYPFFLKRIKVSS